MKFEHVGIATQEAADLAALFAELLDVPIVHEERFGGLHIVFLELDGDGYLELIEPRDGGTIDEYLEENGPGIHHVALETDDVAAALETARDLGITPIDEEPRPGAWGHEVAFLHPEDTGGVLVEFVAH